MPKQVCGFGFDCGSMLMQPGLAPGECPNYQTCGQATRLTPDEEIELIRVREVEQWEQRTRASEQEQARRREVWRTTRREIAVEMLMQRGCPQMPEDYIPEATSNYLTQLIAPSKPTLHSSRGVISRPKERSLTVTGCADRMGITRTTS